MKDFSIKEAFKYGWKMTLAHFGFILMAFIVEFLLMFGKEIVAPSKEMGHFFHSFTSSYASHHFLSFIHFSPSSQLLSLFLVVALGILTILFHIGFLKLSLSLTEGKRIQFKHIFSYQEYFWTFIGTSILTALFFFLGTILLIIPGIIFALMFSLAVIASIDLDLSPLQALEKSRQLTKGVRWKLLGFYMIIGVLNMFGASAFVIGLLVTVPISLFAILYIYKTLSVQTMDGNVAEMPGAGDKEEGTASTIEDDNEEVSPSEAEIEYVKNPSSSTK